MIVFGQTITIAVKFGKNGVAFDPLAFHDVLIMDPMGNVKATLTPAQVAPGEYQVSYTIPALGPAGVWSHNWDYQAKVGMAYHSFYYTFTVDGSMMPPHSTAFIGPHSEEIQ